VYESGKNLWSEAGVQESVYTFIISSWIIIGHIPVSIYLDSIGVI
jgi:hypothetical protein